MRSRNFLEPMGLAILMIGFWLHFVWWESWVIMAMGGIVYVCSLFYARDPEFQMLSGKEFLRLLTLSRAPIGMRVLYYTLGLAAVITLLYMHRLWEWYTFVGLFVYTLFFAGVQNWYYYTWVKAAPVEVQTNQGAAEIASDANHDQPTESKQLGMKEFLRMLTLPGAPVWVKALVILCDVGLVVAAVNYQRLGGFFLPVLAVCALIQAPLIRKYWNCGNSPVTVR